MVLFLPTLRDTSRTTYIQDKELHIEKQSTVNYRRERRKKYNVQKKHESGGLNFHLWGFHYICVPVRNLSLIFSREGMEDDWEGDHNSIHSEGGREKNNQKLKKRYYVSSKAFEGEPKFLR